MSTRRRLTSVFTITGIWATLLISASTSAQAAPTCDPVLFTVVGSDQGIVSGETEMTRITQVVKAEAAKAGRTVTAIPIAYPAVPFTRFLDWKTQDLNGLSKSERKGVEVLNSAIEGSVANCPGRPLMLAGYSQGADVVSMVAIQSRYAKSISVGMLGNPSFKPSNAYSYGSYDAKRVGIRLAFSTTTYDIPENSTVAGRTVDACLLNDAVCNFNKANVPSLLNSSSSHFKYNATGYTAYVGRQLWKFGSTIPTTAGSFTVSTGSSTAPEGTSYTAEAVTPCPAGSTVVLFRIETDASSQRGQDWSSFQISRLIELSGGLKWRAENVAYTAEQYGRNPRVRAACFDDNKRPLFIYEPQKLTVGPPLQFRVTAAKQASDGSITAQIAGDACPAPANTAAMSATANSPSVLYPFLGSGYGSLPASGKLPAAVKLTGGPYGQQVSTASFTLNCAVNLHERAVYIFPKTGPVTIKR